MAEVQFIQTSPSALAHLIGEEVREQLETYAAKLHRSSHPDGKEVLTRKETAKFFGVSLVTIHEWTKAGILHPYKVGARIFYRRSHLMEVLEKSNPTKG